jgi:hypothetical protein
MGLQDERELDALFASYREAVPDQEPSAEFTIKLWQAIDGRQKFKLLSWRRWTEVFVSASLALCILFTLAVYAVERQQAPHLSSYVDVLNDDGTPETLAYAHTTTLPDEELKK